MAQRVSVVLVDDVDGTPAAETVSFGLDGVTYEIDLSDENAGKLRDSLASWIGSARRSGGRRTAAKGASAKRSAGGPSASVIREWATANGFTVSERGRISAEVREAYDAAN